MSIFLKTGRVKSEWTDYNGHMNLAYYIHLFDTAWEAMLEKFLIGEDSAKIENRTTFAVESHTTYDQEVRAGEEVDMNLLFIDYDKKRIVYKMEMINKQKQYLAATSEILSVYVDLKVRRVVEFEPEKASLINEFIKSNKSKFNPGELILISKLKKTPK
tara:strand:+ start:100 stop:576 length:477 start_codon:yes stop_codon:yes gene_type:complete